MNRHHTDLLANTIYDQLGVSSDGFFTAFSVTKDHVEEGYVDTGIRRVHVVDRNDVKYKITIEEII